MTDATGIVDGPGGADGLILRVSGHNRVVVPVKGAMLCMTHHNVMVFNAEIAPTLIHMVTDVIGITLIQVNVVIMISNILLHQMNAVPVEVMAHHIGREIGICKGHGEVKDM